MSHRGPPFLKLTYILVHKGDYIFWARKHFHFSVCKFKKSSLKLNFVIRLLTREEDFSSGWILYGISLLDYNKLFFHHAIWLFDLMYVCCIVTIRFRTILSGKENKLVVFTSCCRCIMRAWKSLFKNRLEIQRILMNWTSVQCGLKWIHTSLYIMEIKV